MSAAVPAVESSTDLVEDGRFAVAEAAGYAYHLYVQPGDGRRRRWRGRVVRIDPTGRAQPAALAGQPQPGGPARAALDETVRDLQALVARGTPIAIFQNE